MSSIKNNKVNVNASPPSATKSHSNSTSVQHDQIPIHSSSVTHSSASYKQELMDSSLLLDNINEALSIWDSSQSNSQTLPSFHTANLFSPLSSATNNQQLISVSNAHIPNQKRRHSHGKRRHPNGNTDVGVNAYGPHQYYIKDDTVIKPDNKPTHKKHKHKHKRHHHNISRTPINIRDMDDIPEFVSENDRRLNLLGEMIELKRSELERISGRHDHTLSCIISLYISATASVISLRKQHRDLSSFAEQLSREGQIRNTISDNILSTLHNIEEQRKLLLNKIESPSWEIKHHFHILSFEHFRGNQQPHLLEIAQVLPSRLQIAAISHQSTNKNDLLLKQFNIAQKERDLLYKKLSQIDKKRSVTQCHLKDYKKMMTIIKKNIGEKRLNKLKTKLQSPHGQTQQMERSEKMRVDRPNLNNKDPFRKKYLSGIGIRSETKPKFILTQFVEKINEYLCMDESETQKELDLLNDNTDLINPITGQINNPSTVDETDPESEQKSEEKKESNGSEVRGNYGYKFIEKPLRQNVLSIIDKSQFIVGEEQRTEKENIVKTVYSVSLKSDSIKSDERREEKSDEIIGSDLEMDRSEHKSAVMEMDKDLIDAPHRDWSVLAKHLKDSSKEQARRKQILKQLERILHVREGLIVGFDQLKEIYNNFQNQKFQK